MEIKYPYVVVRWIAAVYEKRRIEFQEFPTPPMKDFVQVYLPGAEKLMYPLPPSVKKTTVEVVKKLILKSRRPMCVVLAVNEFVFIELDGTISHSTYPPDGGLLVKSLQ